MPVICPHCQSKFSYRDGLNRHQPKSKRCQKNVLKKKLIIESNLKCAYDCNSKPLKNEASLLNHYKNHCVEIPKNQKAILFPLLKQTIDDDSDIIPSNLDQNEERTVDISEGSLPAERILTSIGLKFHVQYGIFQCYDCKVVIGKNYLEHARRVHKRPLLNIEQKNTVSIFVNDLITSSPYFSKSNELLEPIHFIEEFNGFRCTICPYYCRTNYSKQEHIKNHNEAILMIPCKIQTIAGDEAKKKTYFGVKAKLPNWNDNDGTIEKRNNVNVIFQSAKNELIQKIIQKPKLNRFYTKLGWWQEEDSDNNFKDSCKSLGALPIIESEKIMFNSIKNAYIELIKKISNIKYPIRAIFTKKDSVNILEPLQSADSYAHLFAKMIWFFRKARTFDRFLNLFDQSTNELLEKTIDGDLGDNFKTLLDLGLNLVRQPFSNFDMFLFELFLKVNCINRDGTLLQCSEFERVCSKTIFFCKLNILGRESN